MVGLGWERWVGRVSDGVWEGRVELKREPSDRHVTRRLSYVKLQEI